MKGQAPAGQCHTEHYKSAYAKSLQKYCVTEDAFELGLNGKSYHNGCDTDFSAQYNEGREIYQLKQQISSLKSQRDELDTKLAKAEEQKDIDGYKSQLNNVNGQLKSAKKKLKGKLAVHAIKSKSLKSLLDTI